MNISPEAVTQHKSGRNVKVHAPQLETTTIPNQPWTAKNNTCAPNSRMAKKQLAKQHGKRKVECISWKT
jgi:hypothetical protein